MTSPPVESIVSMGRGEVVVLKWEVTDEQADTVASAVNAQAVFAMRSDRMCLES